MKILHVALRGPVTDGWNYQENMLIKYHKKLGHDVTILTSKWTWGSDGKLHKTDRSDYYDEDGVHFIRVDLKGHDNFLNKFKMFKGVYDTLERVQPDFIFGHESQYIDTIQIVKYVKRNPHVKLIVDNHVDFSNSATNWLSRNILHKLIWGVFVRNICKYADRVYGVLPARVDFMKDMYHVPAEKVSLLEMGADDELIESAAEEETVKRTRERWNIKEDDFLIVTGGKIDEAKAQTLMLMEAVREIPDDSVRLLVFGSVADSIKERFDSLVDGEKVQYIGWIDVSDSYQYFAAAQLAAFPGRHSVFWEQVAGQGKVMLCKHWKGTTHVDGGGNVRFLYQDSVNEIKEQILDIRKPENYAVAQRAASENASRFRYMDIAKRCLDNSRTGAIK